MSAVFFEVSPLLASLSIRLCLAAKWLQLPPKSLSVFCRHPSDASSFIATLVLPGPNYPACGCHQKNPSSAKGGNFDSRNSNNSCWGGAGSHSTGSDHYFLQLLCQRFRAFASRIRAIKRIVGGVCIHVHVVLIE